MEDGIISYHLNTKLSDSFRKRNRGFGGRKYSTPAALNADRFPASVVVSKRRFSNVGDVVSRKLSTTIGWRTAFVPSQEVILAGRTLCVSYIKGRLKRAGLFTRKIGLNRPRVMIDSLLVHENIMKEVFPCLNHACMELERLHPTLFVNLARQLNCFDKMDDVMEIIIAVGQEIFETETNWGNIIAIFCVAAGLSVDCVKLGVPENVTKVSDGMTVLLEDRIAEWITINGGWMSLASKCRQGEDKEIVLAEYSGIFVLVSAILAISYFAMRFLLKYVF